MLGDKSYEVGQFYLVGSVLMFMRRGNPKIHEVDMTPHEAAEYVAKHATNMRGYAGQPLDMPQGVRIFTSNRKQKRKSWQ